MTPTLIAYIVGQGVVALVAVLGYLGTRRSISGVHHIVNQQRTDGQKYQEDLRSALSSAGVAIPPDASLAPADQQPGA